MIDVKWTRKSISDVERLYEFLAPLNRTAAARAVQTLVNAPSAMRANPRIGEQLFEFQPREVRRLIVGPYEIRYEVQNSAIYILRIWHTREDR